MDLTEIKELDEKYIVGTYGRYPVQIVKGKNSVCYDEDNKKYIDFTSGIGVNSLGFSNDLINKAIIEQLENFSHTSNLYYSSPCVKIAEKICKTTGMSKVFFCNSGAESNECAIKTARKYSFDKYGKNRNQIITLENSFHGRTIATLTATGQDVYHNYFFPFVDGFLYTKTNDFSDFLKTISNQTCGVIVELIQGEGGVVPLNLEYVKQIEEVCKKMDILLIIDEVQTGIGRCGSLFAYEDYNISPDIVTCAKGLGGGLPIGAVLFSEKTSEVLTKGTHGTTFGGNPVVCAGSLPILNTVCEKSFLSDVVKKGNYIKENLINLTGVKDISGKGLMLGITLDKNIKAIDVVNKAIENGLLVLTAKEKIRFLPPLNISYEEIDEGLLAFKKTLNSFV